MRRRSQVTSKRGDKGETTTLGGDDVSKSHPVIECCGCVDELRAAVALVRQEMIIQRPEDAESQSFLWWLLHCCFAIGSQCSDPRNAHPEYRKVDIGKAHINALEAFQHRLEEAVQLPKSFIVSASNPIAARVDVLTTQARRLERALVRVKESVPEFESTNLLVFVNRLSDTLYMLARKLEDGKFQPVDYTTIEKNQL
ncbi:MAG TPA: ATP:cob(I)alamin adenosyltransferase [Candidatus Hydrogenedentes bacterium]|nr:ATP:cob(I)alamin adenosyltransferase [Candidatus Hydrogenedentota bacterium]